LSIISITGVSASASATVDANDTSIGNINISGITDFLKEILAQGCWQGVAKKFL